MTIIALTAEARHVAAALTALPTDPHAALPMTYESAVAAMEMCASVDECQAWKVKADAMASYARQMRDETLHNLAVRIAARAARRCGELLELLPPKHGANQNIGATGGPKVLTRTAAAEDAGLSPRQRKTALRLASVPADVFEAQVESATPPTVRQLARQGTAPRPKPLIDLGDVDPRDFQVALQAAGMLREFCDEASRRDPVQVARGFLDEQERNAVRHSIADARAWLDHLSACLGA